MAEEDAQTEEETQQSGVTRIAADGKRYPESEIDAANAAYEKERDERRAKQEKEAEQRTAERVAALQQVEEMRGGALPGGPRAATEPTVEQGSDAQDQGKGQAEAQEEEAHASAQAPAAANQAAEEADEADADENTDESGDPMPEGVEFPHHKGGGHYVLSDGSVVQGKEDAAEAQSKLD